MDITKEHEQQIFDTVKEDRGSYFVEYSPPRPAVSFATLHLIFASAVPENVADLIETEARYWLGRYDVALMATSFDGKDDVIKLDRPDDHAVAWRTPEGTHISWTPSDLDERQAGNPERLSLREIYADIPYRTMEAIKSNVEKSNNERRRQVLTLKFMLIIWLVAIPVAVALFEFFAPQWIVVLLLSITFWQSWRTWRKVTGRAEPSVREEKKAEEERRMKHYFYHCERNPLGFARLKAENFEKDIRARINAEADELTKTSKASTVER